MDRLSSILSSVRSFSSSYVTRFGTTLLGGIRAVSSKAPISYADRHIGPRQSDIEKMLKVVGVKSLQDLMEKTVPESIQIHKSLNLPKAASESEALAEMWKSANENEIRRSLIGMGFYGTKTPTVILRNVLENPAWYTSYTPYQAEISQGRLEMLLNFQQVVSDLTGLPVANASLLDEATAAAEALLLCYRNSKKKKSLSFFASDLCHPQDIALLKTRAQPFGIEIIVGDVNAVDMDKITNLCGVMIAYPGTEGSIIDYTDITKKAHEKGALVACITDLMALTVMKPPGEFGCDIAFGSAQRFGVPMGYGGPHAAFFAVTDALKRTIPGRIIGVSKDRRGNLALRMTLQTREQHIRRERATSNICTAQALLADVAAMYAIYHGPEGLKAIASDIHRKTSILRSGLEKMGYKIVDRNDTGLVFDTVTVCGLSETQKSDIIGKADQKKINLRMFDEGKIGLSLDEETTEEEIDNLLELFSTKGKTDVKSLLSEAGEFSFKGTPFERQSGFLDHPTFNKYHSEHEMLRYLKKLENKDYSLANGMIPLGSCTMKLNPTTGMIPITWSQFGNMHPFVPKEQASGYQRIISDLESWLAEITGFSGCSLQPIAGSQGEYAGLMVIREYLKHRGEEKKRDICLIPVSAHGTNPASAITAGFVVKPVGCDKKGNVDIVDLKKKIEKFQGRVGAIMITYPSTHGIFEVDVKKIIEAVHEDGGLVYLDGANMNAQVGWVRPGDIGADVCHLNLHKTFAIPHGGGGPPSAPICVSERLKPYLPGHTLVKVGGAKGMGPVSGTPWAVPSILPITWSYIRMMGGDGLKKASEVAVLSANYVRKRLDGAYKIVYTGESGFCGHEFILDLREFKPSCGVEAEDVAKRLMDYGLHAPTLSFPIPGTLMIEPTESESLEELDRICDALLSIREEIREIKDGKADKDKNVLKMAPHTAEEMTEDQDMWTKTKPYSRKAAAYPVDELKVAKFWPAVNRVDNVWGDRNFFCACPPVSAFEK